MKPATVVAVALAAGALGVVASLLVGGPGPLLRTEFGQRLLNHALSASAPAPPAGVTIGRLGHAIPRLRLPDQAGNRIDLPGAFAGKPLLINVWASWCGPCVAEMPALQQFAREQGTNGTQVVGIALDDAESVRAYLRRVPVSYPILLDTPGPVDAGVRLGNPKGVLPYSILVSPDGRLRKQRIGPFAPGEIRNWAKD